MSIIEPIITLDGLIQQIRPGMSEYEAECLQDEFYNAIIDFSYEASKEILTLRNI